MSTAPDVLAACETATFPTDQRVVALLCAGNAAEVALCLGVAREHRVPLHPISRGRNWGLGSRVPAADCSAILDLSRMDAITAFDARMGTITVEPGVTFRQVHEHLRNADAPWFLPAIGGPGDASVIGNLAERGGGSGPTGERARHACALTVVLPDGSMVTTGFGMFPGAAMTTLSRHGPGPSLDGLFLQSNFGIIVAATLFLSPTPADLRTIHARVSGGAGLAAALDVARALVRDAVIQPNCLTVWNPAKAFMIGRRYPFIATMGETPLPRPRDEADRVWHIAASINAASPAIGAALSDHAAGALRAAGAEVAVAEMADEPALRAGAAALGAPHEAVAATVYWRKTAGPRGPLAPEADRCGLHWLCFPIPLVGESTVEAMRLIEDTAHAHGFEAAISGAATSHRVLDVFVAIIYDRDSEGHDAAARTCHDTLLDAMSARGIHPSRLGIQSMRALASASPPYAALIRTIHHALDPHAILAPGHYEF